MKDRKRIENYAQEGCSSLSVIVTHTQAHKDTNIVLGNPSRPPSSHQRAAHRTPWTHLIHNAHRQETLCQLLLSPLPPSPRPLLLPPLAKAKKEKKEKKEQPLLVFSERQPKYECMSIQTMHIHAWTHCTDTLWAHTGFNWAHLSSAKIRHEPSWWWISLVALTLNCPTPIAHQLNQSCSLGKRW